MYRSPTLYKTSSSGKEVLWNISTNKCLDENVWRVFMEWGYAGGVVQSDYYDVTVGKNVGKANETTVEEQADAEALAKFKKQLDKGYSETPGGASKQYKPMLAHSYDDHKAKVKFPCYIQPKLDGMRCIAIREGNEITLMSRGGKVIEGLKHIREDLLILMMDGEIWDGELYNHEITFQELMSLVKRDQEDSKKVNYFVYDSLIDGTFEERFMNFLHTLQLGNITVLETQVCNSHDEIKAFHDSFVRIGYEGAIVRHGECRYKNGGRSNQLLKVKAFFDAEYTIVDVIPSEKRPEHGIFVCAVPNSDVTFNATPEGSFELKEQYLQDRDKLVGKQLTVRYFELTTSETPVPRFPIAVGVRDESDL